MASFSTDGDFLGSPFSRAFGIGYYDDATREAVYFETARHSLPAMLTGCSYDDVVIPSFESLPVTIEPGDNCAILLYEIRCEGIGRCWSGPGVSLRFVGTAKYV